MQEENLKNEEQVSTVYSLNSKLELVTELEIKNKREIDGKKSSHFYWGLLIFDILLLFLMILSFSVGYANKSVTVNQIIAFLIFEAIISLIIITVRNSFK